MSIVGRGDKILLPSKFHSLIFIEPPNIPPIICFATDKELSVFLSWGKLYITNYFKPFLANASFFSRERKTVIWELFLKKNDY